MALDLSREWSVEELRLMKQDALKWQEEQDPHPDLALKDATQIYYNGPLAREHVTRAADNLKKLRSLNSDGTPVNVEATTQIPLGAMLYFAGDKLFAFGIEVNEKP